jgi:hypothetical protein
MKTILHPCRICGSETAQAFTAKILRKYNVRYYICEICDFLQTETPYWLDEAYVRPLTLQDTGCLQRNIHLCRALSLTLNKAHLNGGRFLDYAAGYGVLTRLMRDVGFDYYWNDPYAENLFASGFEESLKGSFTAISAFEVIEHWAEPLQEIQKLFNHTQIVFLSTEIRPMKIPLRDWMYYGFDHGQHVGLFSTMSLSRIAQIIGATLLSDHHSFHVLSKHKGVKMSKTSGALARIQFEFLRHRMKSLTQIDSLSYA